MNNIQAILLMAYGGPECLDDVEPFLLDIRGGRLTSPELIEEIRGRYAAIGGKSPLLEITRRQAVGLEKELNQRAGGQLFRVFIGMRHWKPYIRETIREIAEQKITHLTTICMTPFESRMSTGAYYEKLESAMLQPDIPPEWRTKLLLQKVGAWYNHPGFVNALADNLITALHNVRSQVRESPVVVFSAHSLPAALVDQGDPYQKQFEDLCVRVAEVCNLSAGEWTLCFQSAGAKATRWLGPSLEETIKKLATQGVKSILVSAIGFLADHVEVLFDLDIEARQIAQYYGVELFRTPQLNDHSLFINSLAEIILNQNGYQF
jgi:ferrochelatase